MHFHIVIDVLILRLCLSFSLSLSLSLTHSHILSLIKIYHDVSNLSSIPAICIQILVNCDEHDSYDYMCFIYKLFRILRDGREEYGYWNFRKPSRR